MRFSKRAVKDQEFQLAPMVDILFILLIFFIVTSSYQTLERELSIALPDAANSSDLQQSGRDILVNITSGGTYVINRKEYSLEGLRDLLSRTKEALGSRTILIRADIATKYEAIVKVMDLCAELQITKISFVTREQEQ